MSRHIPERWLNYKPIGQQIKGTQFIAFKVPLSAEINKSVDDAGTRFDMTQLLEKVPNLGMVIDLTNTQKYYGPNAFDDTGIKYVKLMIPGHQVPSDYHANKFTDYVNEFLETETNKGKLIGVHCTHGVNRTGYLICYHMVTSLKMQPDEAMKVFEEARGHRLERQNYRDNLASLVDIQKDYEKTVESWQRPSQIPSNNSYRPQSSMETIESWRRPPERSSYDSYESPPHQNTVKSRSMQPQRPSNREGRDDYRPKARSSYRSATYNRHGSQDHRNSSISNISSKQYDNSQRRERYAEQSHPLSTSSRRDPLPSNDYSSRYSVLAEVYADLEPPSRSRYSWRRPR